MSAVTRVYSPTKNGMPNLQAAAARKRAAELELLQDLERELLMPVPPPPKLSAYTSGSYGFHQARVEAATAPGQMVLF